MRSLLTPGLALLFAGALVSAGCGGGGGGSTIPRAGTAAKATYSVRIAIPTGSGTTLHGKRLPKFVSPSLQSIVVAILGAQNQQLVQGNDFVNVTATGSTTNGDCMTTAGVVTCTLALSAAIGTGGNFTVVVATYDAQQTAACLPHGTPACTGNLLSITDLPQNITAGQTLSVTLGGIPAFLQPLELVSGYVSGLQGALVLYGPGPQKVSFEFLDAGHNVIIGAGAPALTVTSTNPSALQASVSTVAASGVYTLTFNPQTVMVGGLPVVQAGSVPLQFTGTIPGTTLSTGITIPIQIQHSALYVGAFAVPPLPGGTYTIYAYFDGNSAPSWNVYDSGFGMIINTDNLGNLWAADAGNNKVAEWINPQPNSAPGENDPAIVPGYYPDMMAFDVNGNAFVANCVLCFTAGTTTVDEFFAPNPLSTPNFTAIGSNLFSSALSISYAIAVDDSDLVYYGQFLNPSTGYMNQFPGGAVMLNNGITGVHGVAVDPITNFIWAMTGLNTIKLINPAGPTVVNTINNGNLTLNTDMKTDQLGNIYVPFFTGGGVMMFSPPAYGAPTTLAGTLTNSLTVAVWPNAMIGQLARVGVIPNPTPSPTPLPAPT